MTSKNRYLFVNKKIFIQEYIEMDGIKNLFIIVEGFFRMAKIKHSNCNF